VNIVDPITQSNLVTMRIEDLLRERQPRHEVGATRYGGPAPATISAPIRAALHLRLRRRLGALLIQAGRRLADNSHPRRRPLFATDHR
jgi:hypothetical protein